MKVANRVFVRGKEIDPRERVEKQMYICSNLAKSSNGIFFKKFLLHLRIELFEGNLNNIQVKFNHIFFVWKHEKRYKRRERKK